MTTMTRYAMSALLLLASTLPARADETPSERLQQDQELEEAFGWNGDAPEAGELLRRIAAARVVMRAEGNLVEAELELNRIWLLATATKGFEGQDEVLVQIALARAELYRRQGDEERALQATRQLLVRSVDLDRLQTRRALVTLASKALVIRAVQAAQDPRLLALRAELQSPQAASGHDSLAKIVRAAYAAQEYQVIVEIGAPAQPAFAAEIVADAEQFPPSAGSDPLLYLLKVNERQAAELLLANLDAGGYLWKRRIVRAMDAADVMNNDGTWSSGEPFVCLEPEWLSVLEALLSSPDTALQSVHLITEPLLRDQLTPGIQQALIRGIGNFDLDFVNAVLQALDQGGVVESGRPVLEAAARHMNPQVRRFAARMLANYESNAVLESMADDPDPEVRASVIQTLQPHGGQFLERFQQQNGVWMQKAPWVQHQPALDEADRELIRRFARDPDAKVRLSAARALFHLDPPLEDEVYLELTRDESAEVRRSMAWVDKVSTELRSRLLVQLAQDTTVAVVQSVDDVLEEAPLESDPAPYLDALELRLIDPRFSMEGTRLEVVKKLVASPRGLQAVASWMLAGDDRSLQDLFFDRLYYAGTERALGLDDAALGGLFARAHDYEDADNSNYYYYELTTAIRNAHPSRREAMRGVLRDASLSASTRLNAAVIAAPDGGAAFAESLRDLMRNAYWTTHVPTSSDLDTLADVVDALPERERNPFVLSVLADDGIVEALAIAAASRYSETGPLSREVTLAILERWFRPDVPYAYPVKRAIQRLAALPDDADLELLQAAALRPEYAIAAVQTLIALRRDESLPTLARCMRAEWIAGENDRMQVQFAATRGISSFLTDEAAEILLAGLSSPNDTVRQIAASGLTHIESTRERIRRWEELELEQPTKDSALAELLLMLDGKNQEVRVQAIRGIATFGALEYLPTLIRLLQDPDGKVVEAARTAIDELNRNAATRSAADESE